MMDRGPGPFALGLFTPEPAKHRHDFPKLEDFANS